MFAIASSKNLATLKGKKRDGYGVKIAKNSDMYILVTNIVYFRPGRS